ncbi:hypothetical protein NW759_017365 [Fusarium solani]|nr:hypothetical protein NW759_017365 [Fusarium solani]
MNPSQQPPKPVEKNGLKPKQGQEADTRKASTAIDMVSVTKPLDPKEEKAYGFDHLKPNP